MLHDIGKIAISDVVPSGTAPLGLEEWESIKQHPLLGERICRHVHAAQPLLPFIRSHHEKLDGSGYPDGLSGDSIPLAVQILAVANVYDALRSDRAYRPAYTHDEAIALLRHEVTRGWWNAEAVALMTDCDNYVGPLL